MTIFFRKISVCSLAVILACLATFPAWAAKKTVDKIVAIVNQDIILQSEFLEFKKIMAQELKKDPANQDTENSQGFDNKAIQTMIENKLVEQEIKALGLEATDSQIENVIAEVMKSNGLQTRRELDRALHSEGITYEDFVSQYKERIGRSNLVNQTLRPKVKISEDEVETEYKKRTKGSDQTLNYHVAMIFLNKDNTSPKQMEKLKSTLMTVEEFSKVAGQVSEGPAKDKNGDLGWINPSDLQSPLGDELQKMKKGDISKVLTTDQGYYLLACLETEIKKSDESERIKEKIRDDLMNNLLTKNLNQYVIDLKRKAHIETFL